MADYRTISEVSHEVGVEPHTIRFWEKEFVTLHPVKRRGNRRYYSEEDVATLNEIRRLLHYQGYTIKGAKQAMKQKKEPKTDSRQTDIFEVLEKPTDEQKKSLQKILDHLKEAKELLKTKN